MSPAIVDAWIQHPAPGFLADPMFASLLRWMGVDEPPDDLPLEITLGALDAAGIGTALTCAWHGPQGTLISNEFVAETVAASGGRLVGVASVDIRQPMEAVRALRRAVEDLGFVALRLLPWLWELPPDDRRYYPLYAACVDLDIPFCLQAGHAGPLRPSEPGRPIPYLDRVACDFPELRIVAGHIGFPWTTEMISLARKYENVYIDTSAYKPSRYPQELVEYLRKGGRRKVLFGSNYPMLPPAVCLAEVGDLGLDDEVKAAFLGDNARRVFRLGPAD